MTIVIINSCDCDLSSDPLSSVATLVGIVQVIQVRTLPFRVAGHHRQKENDDHHMIIIQGGNFNWPPLKSSKYKKVNLS